MSTELQALLNRRRDIATELEEMNSNAAGGKPDAAGKNVGHVAYRLSLLQERIMLNQEIAVLSGGAQVDVIGRI